MTSRVVMGDEFKKRTRVIRVTFKNVLTGLFGRL